MRVREALSKVLAISVNDRNRLQQEGAALDRRTNGRWLAEFLLETQDVQQELVVDSVRTERQTIPILERVPGAFLAYLEASSETRRRRFDESAAADPVKRSMAFAEAMSHPTEQEVTRLRGHANIIIETDDLTADAVVAEIQLALQPM